MRVIWKFVAPSTPLAVIELENVPVGAKFVNVDFQESDLCFWAIVNPNAQTEQRTFALVMTGQTVPDDFFIDKEHIKTIQRNRIVCHIFEVKQ